MATRLLIVDDHEDFRAFARTLLGSDGFDVTGEAGDGESALTEVKRLQPDVVLLDVQLPGIDGFEVARRLADAPDAPTVVLTSSRDADDLGAKLEGAPISGFIPKRQLSSGRLAALVPAH